MTLEFDSLQKKTIQEVLEWYEFLVQVLGREKARVLEELRGIGVSPDSRFFGWTREEIEDFFNLQHNELDFVAMLDLMAAAEATIRLDYLDRVSKRKKDKVSKEFRKLDKSLSKQGKGDKVFLEEHILDTWACLAPQTKSSVGDFKGTLTLRHWLAHGRYWDPKMGRQKYSPGDVFDISDNLIQAISNS